MPERSLMTPLSGFYSDIFNFDNADPNIASFYVGYENIDDLAWQSELELVQTIESSSLGGIWAALGVFLRREQFALNIYGPNQVPAGPSRPPRQAARQSARQAQQNTHIIQMQASRRRPQDSTRPAHQSTSESHQSASAEVAVVAVVAEVVCLGVCLV